LVIIHRHAIERDQSIADRKPRQKTELNEALSCGTAPELTMTSSGVLG
jgi:hypothetical protein